MSTINSTYLAAAGAAVVAYIAYRSYSQSKTLKGMRDSKTDVDAAIPQSMRHGGIYSTEHEASDFQEFPPGNSSKVLSVRPDIFGIPVSEILQEDGSILRAHTKNFNLLL